MSTLDGFLGLGAVYFSSASTVLLAVAVMLLGWLLHLYIVDQSRYPRGPLRLPAVGNILHLLWHGDIIEFLMQSWRRYGDIFTIQIGSKKTVVLNGYDTINDALVKKAKSFSEHSQMFNVPGVPPNEGIVSAQYPVWKDHRKLFINVVKDLGYVKQDLEEKVNQEVVKIIGEISAQAQQPFATGDIMVKATANVISSMVFGWRFEYDDKELILLMHLLRKLVAEGGRITVLQLFPMLQYLPIEFFKFDNFVQMNAQFLAIMEKKIAEIEHNLTSAPPSFIKAYLEEVRKNKNLGTGSLTKSGCVSSAQDLFIAGYETTTTALEWAFLHCVVHSDMQERIHHEIDHVLGQRAATFADRGRMPFINAFLTEVLRFSSIVPLALPHKVIHDAVLNGTFIPKDTEIIVNLHSILHDERIFDEPSTFRPARFLDRDAKFLQPEKLAPFGLGRRICAGEEVAQIELFQLFTATMQRFTLLPAPGMKLSTKALFGIVRRPPPFRVIALPR